VIDHVRATLGLDAGVTAEYDVGCTGTRHRDYVRTRVGAVWESARARAVAETAMREALVGKDNPADVINGEDALAAAENLVVGGVPVLHDLQAAADLPAKLLVGEVVAGEDGAHGPAERFEGEVDGVLRAVALHEAAQYLVGLGGPEPKRGGVLDHLVGVAGDEVPVDR
jgi:hypothetical protein